VTDLNISRDQVRIELLKVNVPPFSTHSEELKDEDALEPGSSYIVAEAFSIVPSDVFRTIGLHQYGIDVFAHPDIRTDFTPAAPGHAAVLRDNGEQSWPAVASTANGIKFHGVSLHTDPTCGGQYSKKFEDNDDPFDKNSEFNKGGYTMSAQRFINMVSPEGFFDEGNRLLNKATCSSIKKTRFKRSEQKEGAGKRKKTFYHLYKLHEGVDVGKLGMLLVFDASSKGHASMIRTADTNDSCHEEYSKYMLDVHYKPGYAIPGDLRLKYEAMSEQEEQPFSVSIDYFDVILFPCIASRFEFHSFKMQASAEPAPIDFENDDSRKLHGAVTVLWHLSSEPDVNAAISKLEDASFNPENVEEDVLSTLESALWNISMEDIELMDDYTTEMLKEKLEVANFYEVSIEGYRVLRTSLEVKAAGSPGETSTDGTNISTHIPGTK